MSVYQNLNLTNQKVFLTYFCRISKYHFKQTVIIYNINILSLNRKAKLEKDFNEKMNRKFTLKTSTIDNISPSTEKQ